MNNPSQPTRSPAERVGLEETFNRARDEFLAGLSEQDRLLYLPCASPTDFLSAVEKLKIITQSRDRRHQDRAKRWIGLISKLSVALKPYLDTIGVFVSSNPQYTALIWGSLRLILQLASNYTEFFDKLTQLLFSLSESFSQYQRILGIALDEKSTKLIEKYVAEIYLILLEIFHSAIRVFTTSDGKLKRTPVVIGQLMWKPFNVRFSDLVEKLEHRHSTLFDELAVTNLSNMLDERTNAEASRKEMSEEQKRNQEEREAAAAEREMAQRERMLADAERRNNLEARSQTSSKLDQLLGKRQYTEDEYRGKLLSAAHKGIQPPSYADARDRASSVRLDGTATWVFHTTSFKSWFGGPPSVALNTNGTFGSNVMWITGKPGAGKTVLAASIIEHLEGSCPQNDILYFFFQSQSSENSSSDAYRSVLAQLLQKSGHDLDLLYRFSFAIPKPDEKKDHSDVSGLSNDGQKKFTSTIIFELLRLCLRRGSILVLDGIDECRDLDVFILSLRRLLETHPHARVVLLSRINIARLKHTVQDQCHLEFPEINISTDIGQFLTEEIHELFEEGTLPGSIENTEALVRKLVRGADGMFLWARLMINLLRSPSMTPYQRLEVIERVSVPEGLEKLYERIFMYIASTGPRALNLASSCLAWLTKVAPPMSSFQLREALIIQGHLSSTATRDSIIEFEEAVIMTCAGLVIRAPAEHSESPTFLTLVHISIKEMVEELITNRIWIDQYLTHGLHCIITDCSAARLDLASCCLRKILNLDCHDFSEHEDRGIKPAKGFSAYASAYWLYYIKDAVCKCQPIPDMHPHVKSAAFRALSKLLALLSDLFEKPRTLSSWLYKFYSTSAAESSPLNHPPSTVLSSLANWITHVWAGNIVANDQLLHTLGMFDEELGSIIATWGNDLKARPHIVWDEMASFANSRLFFNSGTTRVTNQSPQIPETRNSQQKLVTLVSKTSQTGMMKGVLSLWTSLPIHDLSYHASLRRNLTLDLTDLCSGWIAEYELWQLVPEPKRISNVSLPINHHDVQLVLHNWLSAPFPDEMHIPLAISCDVQSFSVVHTVFSLASDGWVSRTVPETLRPSQSYLHWRMGALCQYYSKVEFGSNGNYVALAETSSAGLLECASGEQRISVYQYRASTAPVLDIELVGNLDISSGAQRIKDLLFHPFEEAMAVKIRSRMEDLAQGWETYIHLWHFRQEFPESLTSYQISEQWQKPRTLVFSSCGGYLAATSKTGECNVIPLLGIIPTPSILPISGQEHNDGRLALYGNVLPSWQTSQSGGLSGGLIINNTQTLGPHNVSQSGAVSVSLRGSDLMLSNGNPPASRDISLVTLPNSLGVGQTSQSVRLPQDSRQPIGISIDIEPRDIQVISSSIPAPMYVERDPRVVLMRNSGKMIGGSHVPPGGVSYNPSQLGRKRIMPDLESENVDHSKRRR